MKCMKLEESSIDNILENLLKRSPNQYDTYQDTVAEILNDVKENGDKALFAYTEKFDKAVITKDTIKVTEEEIKEAYDQVDDSLIEVMKKSLANIRDFHEKQLRNSWFETREDGVILGQRVT
ncbi:MAG: histidinol dehydrogenase, partial [[Ruminococcus] torques]